MTAAENEMPSGVRDTQNWYLDVDPLKIVDHTLIDFVLANGGEQLLDLGCGVGGYAKVLESKGRNVVALDVNEKYVAVAKNLGINARLYDGKKIPLPDKSVDTIFMIEVLEHIPNPQDLISELRRVARHNLIATVPNCTERFTAPLVFDHMLDADHRNFFTIASLRKLLAHEFRQVEILPVVPIDETLAADFLPPWLFRIWKIARKRGMIKNKYYFRLIANALV